MGPALDHHRHSRVALALARSRLMGARYPYYLLADSLEGQSKEGEVTRTPPKDAPTRGDIRQGFVYERVPHITLKSIANNARDRRDLGQVAGNAGAAARRAEQGARQDMGGMGNPA